MRFFKIVCGASALMLLTVSCGDKQETVKQTALPKYPVAIVNRQAVDMESVYPVTVRGKEDIEIRPRIDGFIDAIFVDEGAIVRKGQTLFTIDSPQTDQALTNAKASVESAQARVNIARVDVNRIRPLVEKDIVSMVQLETAESTYRSALAGLAQAEAGLKNAEATKGWTNVTSPVDGLIGEVPFRHGSLVNSGNILTTVANTSNVFAYFSLNEKELSIFLDNLEGETQAEKIRNIPAITLILADGTIYEHTGRIGTITGNVNATTGTASLRAEFPNKEGKLRSGTSGRISIPRHLENIILVPQKAVYAQQDKTLIYVVQGDSAVQRVISVRPTPDSKRYVVTGGLKDGERYITDGIATLSHGKQISVK